MNYNSQAAAVLSDPNVSLGAQLLTGPVRFWLRSVWEGVKIQTLSSKRTGATALIEVLTGLLAADTRNTSCSN